MKRTRRRNILRSIKGNLNRYLSIMFIVALGSGFMAGLAATSPDMHDTADRYMDDYKMYDIDLKSPLGFTDDDVSAVRNVSGIKTALGGITVDAVFLTPNNDSHTCRVYASLGKNGLPELNGFVLKSGRLPENDRECLVQITHGKYLGGKLDIGDKITLSHDNEDYGTLKDNFASESLTVVGFVESPLCISITAEPSMTGTGSISLNVYTMKDYFLSSVYTDIYVIAEGAAELDTFGDEYEELIGSLKEKLADLGESRAVIRADEVKKQYGSAAASVEKLKNAAADAVEKRKSLSAAALAGLFRNSSAASEFAISDPALYASLLKTQQLVSEELKRELDTVEETPEIIKSLDARLKELKEAAEKDYDGNWIVRLRSESVGYTTYDSNVSKLSALSKIFPVFFFAVALLVALTTMTRLVEENRGQIGTLKALGFTNGQILSEYLIFSLSSSFLGCVIGFAVGFRLFPLVISSAYGMMFMLPTIRMPFRPDIAAWVAPITVGSIVVATLSACIGELRSSPAVLMRPKAPVAGKRVILERIPFIWKRLSFTRKVMFRNILRYKKRLFMTVIGVAGCSALLLTGFGIRDSIGDIVDKQYGEIYRYDINTVLKRPVTRGEETTAFFADGEGCLKESMFYFEESGRVLKSGSGDSVKVFAVRDTEKFPDFVLLRERKGQKRIDLDNSGIVLTEKLCEQLGISAGDTVTVENASGKTSEAKVIGVAENYITAYAYMTGETYASLFGAEPGYNRTLCILKDGIDTNAALSEFMDHPNVTYAGSTATLKETFANSIRSINGVVYVLILAAGLLSVVVLYNLTNVNICERRRELATLRVLGFHKRETERYIFRESDLLSFIGSFVGLFVGIWLHSFVVRTIEVDQVMFGRHIYFESYIFAMLISVAFTLFVDLIMRRNVRKTDMVEAMKANE